MCHMQAREDEMHLLECPAYEDIRLAFQDMFANMDGALWPMTDSRMYELMYQCNDMTSWNRFADYLMRVFGARKEGCNAMRNMSQ